jgi:hypothetical protein
VQLFVASAEGDSMTLYLDSVPWRRNDENDGPQEIAVFSYTLSRSMAKTVSIQTLSNANTTQLSIFVETLSPKYTRKLALGQITTSTTVHRSLRYGLWSTVYLLQQHQRYNDEKSPTDAIRSTARLTQRPSLRSINKINTL